VLAFPGVTVSQVVQSEDETAKQKMNGNKDKDRKRKA